MPSREEYIKAILRESFVLWERGQRITMFAGVVLSSLLLGVLLALGIGITFKPIAGLWVSVGLLGWLIFLILVVSPYRLWTRERNKVEGFEAAAKQKINIDWRFRNKTFAELLLTNISSKTLPRIEVSFRNYRKSDGSDITDVLCDMMSVDGRGPSIKLDPLVQTFFRFASVRKEDDGKTFIELTPSGRGPINIIDREIGVKFVVSGENIAGHTIDLRLTLNDDGSLSIEAWEVGRKAVSLGGV